MKQTIITICLCILILFGCQQKNDTSLPDRDADHDQRVTQVRNSSPHATNDLTNTEIAERLADIASRVPHVNQAAAVVAGPYAVVGIDVEANLDRSRVGTIKYTVSEALYHDPYGKTAVVVADADIMKRLQNMGKSIQEGEPIHGIVEELASIVGRYMPEFPVIDDRPIEEDQNKETIEKNEEQKLEQIKHDQSNQHLDE